MKSEINVLPNHTLEYWRVNGVNVIVPEHEAGGEKRGGIPLCIPMFSVQQRPVAGCDLPLHGMVMYSDHGEVSYDEKTNTVTATTHFLTSDKFQWDFTVATTIIAVNCDNTSASLEYKMTVERSEDCINPNEMPLSLGFHPYFNTFGKDFLTIINDSKRSKDEIPKNIIDSDFALYDESGAAVLRTAAGTLAMKSTGFDEYCLWTDNIDSYFCIEPIYQYREFGKKGTGLAAGASKEISVSLTFIPTPR